jgi:asparagine synthase (glutamine-hydrolysing)
LSGATFDGDPKPLVERMLTKLEHRGPDDRGVWSSPDGAVTLGHRRLSILDISASGHQNAKHIVRYQRGPSA